MKRAILNNPFSLTPFVRKLHSEVDRSSMWHKWQTISTSRVSDLKKTVGTKERGRQKSKGISEEEFIPDSIRKEGQHRGTIICPRDNYIITPHLLSPHELQNNNIKSVNHSDMGPDTGYVHEESGEEESTLSFLSLQTWNHKVKGV